MTLKYKIAPIEPSVTITIPKKVKNWEDLIEAVYLQGRSDEKEACASIAEHYHTYFAHALPRKLTGLEQCIGVGIAKAIRGRK